MSSDLFRRFILKKFLLIPNIFERMLRLMPRARAFALIISLVRRASAAFMVSLMVVIGTLRSSLMVRSHFGNENSIIGQEIQIHGQAKPSNGQAKRSNGQAKRCDGQAKPINGQAKRSNGQALTKNSEFERVGRCETEDPLNFVLD